MESQQETIPSVDLSESNKTYATPELVNQWKEFYLLGGHSFHSTTTYYNYLKRYVGYGIDINQKTVDRFRAKNMAGACSGALKNFFNFLVNKKGYPREIQYIYFDKSKSTKKVPEHISALEIEKIIDAFQELKYKNLTIVLYTLGLRVSEGLKLKWSDFSYITWLQDRSKSGSVILRNTKGGKFRVIPVPSFLMEKLYNEHSQRNSLGVPIGKDPRFDLLFDFNFSEYISGKETVDEKQYKYVVVHAEDRYRKMLYKISLQVLGKKINPHQFRHAKAQDLLDRGLPISSLKTFLGHASIDSTEIYAQASPELLRKDMEKLNII